MTLLTNEKYRSNKIYLNNCSVIELLLNDKADNIILFWNRSCVKKYDSVLEDYFRYMEI